MSASSNETVVIKKYANRRLYNTATSTYVTLENLSQMVKEGIEFNVYDAKTNEDITRSVLTQIIVEEEGKSGQNLLPIGFMRHLISFYGDNMQWLVPKYLEHSMSSLTKNQDQIRNYFQTTLGSMFPFGSTIEQMSKQNIAMFERTMKMFAPFGGAGGMGGGGESESVAPATDQTNPSSSASTKTVSPSAPSYTRQSKAERADSQEKAEEDAFTPSASVSSMKKVTPMPTPETARAASQGNVTGDDVQNKIAALQRQLSDMAKNKA
jgi:polyhydroxyalkanoate synthesis repressor PhaR